MSPLQGSRPKGNNSYLEDFSIPFNSSVILLIHSLIKGRQKREMDGVENKRFYFSSHIDSFESFFSLQTPFLNSVPSYAFSKHIFMENSHVYRDTKQEIKCVECNIRQSACYKNCIQLLLLWSIINYIQYVKA